MQNVETLDELKNDKVDIALLLLFGSPMIMDPHFRQQHTVLIRQYFYCNSKERLASLLRELKVELVKTTYLGLEYFYVWSAA